MKEKTEWLSTVPVLPSSDIERDLQWYAKHTGFEFVFGDHMFAGLQREQLSIFLQWHADTAEDPLFYELGISEIQLSRAGKNFTQKTDLENYLMESDFFDQLGFNAIQKQNSLNYLLPKLPESDYYYLTILTPESVAQISQLDLAPTPETLVRHYIAVYPTDSPVLVTSDLAFPVLVEDVGFTVREYGEILVRQPLF